MPSICVTRSVSYTVLKLGASGCKCLERQPSKRKGTRVARCLIVDADRERRASVRLRLERDGYAVREVEDGKTCLAILRASSVDVLVVDLGLVRPASVDLIREAKRQLPSFRIVAVTDASHRARDGSVGEALAAGSVLMIQKPFSFAHLLQVGKFVAVRAQ